MGTVVLFSLAQMGTAVLTNRGCWEGNSKSLKKTVAEACMSQRKESAEKAVCAGNGDPFPEQVT